jgi:hypothetical protein
MSLGFALNPLEDFLLTWPVLLLLSQLEESTGGSGAGSVVHHGSVSSEGGRAAPREDPRAPTGARDMAWHARMRRGHEHRRSVAAPPRLAVLRRRP